MGGDGNDTRELVERLAESLREHPGVGDFAEAIPSTVQDAKEHACGDTLADSLILELSEGAEGHAPEDMRERFESLIQRGIDDQTAVRDIVDEFFDRERGWVK
jgi:hypothetical protein